ncbi:MAG: GxxExxY protein [Phycisphaerales bacterium]|nr:GxxExxY protein [Phycisphaerales bacterium]
MIPPNTKLPDEMERIAHEVIGCAIRVHQTLGPGLLEVLYERAMMIELGRAGLHAASQVVFKVRYADQVIGEHRLDVLVADWVALDLKAVEGLAPVHTAQLVSSLRIADKPWGLLLNFNSVVLKDGLKRVINPTWSGVSKP